MSAIVSSPAGRNRILYVVRLQFINKVTYIWMPLLVLGASWVISLLIFAMIPIDEPKFGETAEGRRKAASAAAKTRRKERRGERRSRGKR